MEISLERYRNVTFEEFWAGLQELKETQKEIAERQKEAEREMQEVREQQKEYERQRLEAERKRQEADEKLRQEAAERQKEYERKRLEAAEQQKEYERQRLEAERKRQEADEKLRQEAAERQKEYERKRQEAKEEQKEYERQSLEAKKKFERELAEQHRKTVQAQEEAAAQQRRTDRVLEDLGKQMGGLHRSFGEMAEHLVAPGIVDRFNEMGFHIEQAATHGMRIFDEKREVRAEIDLFMGNGDYIIAVEVKAQLGEKDIEKHQRRLEILREHANKTGDRRKILGGIAVAILGETDKKKILDAGFYVLEQSGDTMKLDVPEGFVPREW